jgi:hypothetical protein
MSPSLLGFLSKKKKKLRSLAKFKYDPGGVYTFDGVWIVSVWGK